MDTSIDLRSGGSRRSLWNLSVVDCANMRRTAILAAIVLSFFLSACGDDGSSGESLPELGRLHARLGEEPGIFDEAGRRVLLRGVNLNSLGDYYQGNPLYAPIIPLNDQDFPRMAEFGFNVVRLIVHWSLLEPQRDQIDHAYIERVRRAVLMAKANGIYTVLDMHQDAWGKYIASPPGTVCGAGREPAIGWDGAPEWATLFGSRSTCRAAGVRELSSAVTTSFDNFYADTDGIQGQLVKTWAALAAAFAREPAVAGYDLLNEPNFGSDLAGAPAKNAAFSARTIAAIRAGERAAGGFEHIVFFEPVVPWPQLDSAPAAGFTDDPNIVFAPHNYAESIDASVIEETFARAVADSTRYGSTFWVGEYGWFSEPARNKEKLIRYAREEDRLLVGGAWWQWKQACGDPHSIGKQGGTPPAELIHLNYSRCPGDIDLGPVPEWKVVLSRAYPRATPGRIERFSSDGDSGIMEMDVTNSRSGELDIWAPSHGVRPPLVTGEGVENLRVVSSAGGWRIFASVRGDYRLRIQPDS